MLTPAAQLQPQQPTGRLEGTADDNAGHRAFEAGAPLSLVMQCAARCPAKLCAGWHVPCELVAEVRRGPTTKATSMRAHHGRAALAIVPIMALTAAALGGCQRGDVPAENAWGDEPP
ncbi:MAG TPA: hypothetical protein VK324_09565, partial [Tepidisphaeraceae bacterium]|nr:hypothetical protein [Tepidisphaeraceae bacterium]